MQLIKNNPYRIIGLLAGATAKEQDRQIRRLKQYLTAEQEPEGDYSFPSLGELDRTLEEVTEASSKLHLDNDKIDAALFWFWNGNPISDEVAFDALKDGDVETAYQIWDKLITETNEEGNRYWKPVTSKNYSAYHNCSLINLVKANGNLQNAIVGKLYFLQSELVHNFISTVVDETHKTTSKELQLLFLNKLNTEIEKNKTISLDKFIEILNEHDFVAKQDFLKVILQKPINQIEQKIETAKNKRKVNKANGAKAGQELFESTSNALTQLKSIISSNDIKYTSIADKVANEILQCSVDYFNDGQEKDSNVDFIGTAMKLAQLAEKIAIGSLTKDRIKDSINTLEEMKDREISRAIDFLNSVKDAYTTNERQIRAEVKKIEQTDILIKTGQRTINRSAVEDNIKNSIDWQKVNGLLIEVLSDNNLKKIKESDKTEQKKEFLELMNWLKLNSLRSTTISAIIDKYKKIPPKLPFKILSSNITNTDNKPLYTKFIRYVGLNLNVQVTENVSVTLYIKYINPNGSIRRNTETSPNGYSRTEIQNLNLNTKSINLSGWGNSDKCIYDFGENKIEIYVEDFLIHSNKFVVELAPSEKLDIELKKAEARLTEIRNTQYFKSELETVNSEMNEIQEFQLFRSSSTKQMQISEQQRKIASIQKNAKTETEKLIEQQNTIIYKIKLDIQNSEY
ncbi:MAG: hypothetical protein Q7U47_15360 [Paludibacter sp.]|nr:hypothetical protein [Paludibacter sp.]